MNLEHRSVSTLIGQPVERLSFLHMLAHLEKINRDVNEFVGGSARGSATFHFGIA